YDAIQHLREKTRLNIALDNMALQLVGIMPDDPNNPMPFPPPRPVNLKGDRDTKVRVSLQRMLNSYNLTYVILEDSVFVTNDETAVHRMMNQRISVNYKDVPLSKALKELSRATAINMIIDPRQVKDAQATVTLDVDDATIETTVRLLAEVGGMKAV